MPELPEVQTVVSTLRPGVLARTIQRCQVLRPDMIEPAGTNLPALIRRQGVVDLTRRGKRIILSFQKGHLLIHLGMTGRLRIQRPQTPLENHTHLVLHLDDGLQVRFVDPRRFGQLRWLRDAAEIDAGLGPEPLSLSPALLRKQLNGTRRAIKSALLDQQIVAGLGNIYVDESLFAARVHPQTIGGDLTDPQLRKLSGSIKRTIRAAIDAGGSSIRDYVDANGGCGSFVKQHRVYARENQPCVTCKSAIVRIVLGQRSTHFCPTCQRAQR